MLAGGVRRHVEGVDGLSAPGTDLGTGRTGPAAEHLGIAPGIEIQRLPALLVHHVDGGSLAARVALHVVHVVVGVDVQEEFLLGNGDGEVSELLAAAVVVEDQVEGLARHVGRQAEHGVGHALDHLGAHWSRARPAAEGLGVTPGIQGDGIPVGLVVHQDLDVRVPRVDGRDDTVRIQGDEQLSVCVPSLLLKIRFSARPSASSTTTFLYRTEPTFSVSVTATPGQPPQSSLSPHMYRYRFSQPEASWT